MIVDPVQALAAAATSVSPIPTILPTIEYQDATNTGTTTLWVVTIIMLASAIIFTGLSWSLPISKRLYHIVTTLIVIIAFISYFGMATGLGVSYHHVTVTEEHRHGIGSTEKEIYREVYWARYIDWCFTTPLLIIDLALVAGLSGGHIFLAISADIVMILTGLFAAYGNSDLSKWGFYTIACVAYLAVVYIFFANGTVTAKAKGPKVSSFFLAIGTLGLIAWTIYPIVWGVADGARIASVDSEILAYAVLDVIAKPIFGAWLLFTHAKLPETSIEVNGWWSSGLSSEGAIRIDDDEGA